MVTVTEEILNGKVHFLCSQAKLLCLPLSAERGKKYLLYQMKWKPLNFDQSYLFQAANSQRTINSCFLFKRKCFGFEALLFDIFDFVTVFCFVSAGLFSYLY